MFSLRDFLEALLRARRGLYRVWAFAVTSLDAAFAAPPTETEIKLLFSRGRIGLPVEVRKLPFSEEHQRLALIYEFERTDVPPPVLNAQHADRSPAFGGRNHHAWPGTLTCLYR
jgi:hypothetical protein